MSVQSIEGDVLIAVGEGIEAEAAAIEGILGPLTVTGVGDVETYAENIATKVNATLGGLVKVAVDQYGPEFVTFLENAEKAGVPALGAFLIQKGQGLAGVAPSS